MNAYLIDPYNRKIKTVEVGEIVRYEEFKPHLDCDYIDVVRFKAFDLWIDDEGLFSKKEQAFSHVIHEGGAIFGSQMIAGFGFVLSSDDEGNSIPPKITLEELESRIVWEIDSEGSRQAEKIMATPPVIKSFDDIEEMFALLEQMNRNRL